MSFAKAFSVQLANLKLSCKVSSLGRGADVRASERADFGKDASKCISVAEPN